MHDVETLKLIGHCMTTALKLNESLLDCGWDVSDLMTPSHSRFSCLLFAVCVDYDVS